MTEYQFTKDWFNWAPAVWEQLIPLLSGEPSLRTFLEIGSFEGRSSVWIMENMMTDGDHLICVDTWEGGEEHKADGEDMGSVEARFDHNMKVAQGKFPERNFETIKDFSYGALASLVRSTYDFDFIYIDGSHTAPDVLTDACLAWPLLKPKGMMVFDDYMWGEPRDILHRPKPAIDAFCNIFAEQAEIVHVGYQLVVRKKGEE
jgi:predicted O-methyltransferase YrrM